MQKLFPDFFPLPHFNTGMRRITTDNDTSVQKHASCIIDCILRRWYESCEIGELQYRLFSHLIFKLICHTMHWSNSTTRFWTRQMQTLGFLHRVTQVVWVLFFGDYCCWISVRKQKFSPTAYFSQDCVSFNIKKTPYRYVNKTGTDKHLLRDALFQEPFHLSFIRC